MVVLSSCSEALFKRIQRLLIWLCLLWQERSKVRWLLDLLCLLCESLCQHLGEFRCGVTCAEEATIPVSPFSSTLILSLCSLLLRDFCVGAMFAEGASMVSRVLRGSRIRLVGDRLRVCGGTSSVLFVDDANLPLEFCWVWQWQ